MANEHTPGPWLYESEPNNAPYEIARSPKYQAAVTTGDGGIVLADIRQSDFKDTRPSEEAEANACLIAAAPDLLAALQKVLDEPYGCSLCDSGKPRNPAKGHQPDCPYEAARAAIAKARGAE